MRYKALMRTLRKNPDRIQAYYEALKKMLDNEENEEVREDVKPCKRMDINFFYLPHSAVVNLECLTISVRVVFHGSAYNCD